MTRIATLTVLAALLPAGAWCADDKEAGIDGTWQLTDGELAGQKIPEALAKSTKMVIKDGKYKVTVGQANDEGTLKMDIKAKPMAIDIVGTEGPNKEKTILAIYEIKDDTLKVCYDLSGKARPTSFETKPNTQLFLAIYKRVKP